MHVSNVFSYNSPIPTSNTDDLLLLLPKIVFGIKYRNKHLLSTS